MARGLKFRIYKVEGSYYLCRENKGADQLRGYPEADLRLFFRICKSWFSHDAAHIFILIAYDRAMLKKYLVCCLLLGGLIEMVGTCR